MKIQSFKIELIYFEKKLMKLNFALIARHCFSNKMPYYAVAKGRKPGIYATWDECSAQVIKFSGSIYKKFATESEAQNFIKERSSSTTKINSIKEQVAKSVESRILPNKLFPLGSKSRAAISQISFTPSVSKRTFSTISDTNQFPVQASKKRKIASVDADPEFARSSKQEVDEAGFITDEDGYVNVFTDGACSSNGYKNARAGIGVWFQDDHPLNVSRPVEGRPTNNMAEIQAVTIAARQAKKAGIKKLKINTDSKFLISCITKWMPRWKKRGWKTITNTPVINKEELLEMEKELKSLIITWNHVNGHVGIHGNEMADKLAREGCLRYKIKDDKDTTT